MSEKETKPFGRPTKYTPEMCQRICDLVATHGWGIRQICTTYPDIPSPETINQWRYKYPDFSERYLDSRHKQTHALFESALDDIHEVTKYFYKDPISGAMKVDSGIVAAQKAIANQKTHQAARINPKQYATQKNQENENNPQETLSKIAGMVAEFNKTNSSEV